MMTTLEAAEIMQGQHYGEACAFESVEIDSRRVKKGCLFFAIRGDQQDGHAYKQSAHNNGAVGAVVDTLDEEHHGVLIQVADTTKSLGKLAQAWRARFDIPVAGITGSNGKTTVSQMLRQIFDVSIPGIAPQGSFNNHWGVPLTILTLQARHQSAVIEMGMNHSGELAYLTSIVQPTIALINNAAAAHLEGLSDVEGVAKAKGEIIAGVPENGTVVLNLEEAHFDQWCAMASDRQILTFGLSEQADVFATAVQSETQNDTAMAFTLNYRQQQIRIKLDVLGAHNILNALAAATVALAAGVRLPSIQKGLANVSPVAGRLVQKKTAQGACVIDDSYNANPASIAAGLKVLAAYQGRRIAVLGAMAELGEKTNQHHQEIGALAKELGIDMLVSIGETATAYQAGFGKETLSALNIEDAVAQIEPLLGEGVTLLVKGSRSAGMECLVDALVSPENKTNKLGEQPC